MNVGDRVRMIHGNEEGVVTNLLENKLVEVEIQDGFKIPVLKTELVLVNAEEGNHFEATVPAEAAEKKEHINESPKGIYLAYEQYGNDTIDLHFINNTDYVLTYHIHYRDKQLCNGLKAGALEKKSSTKINTLHLNSFESWEVLHFNIMYFRSGNYSYIPPFFTSFKPKAASFYKSKKAAPILNRDAFVFQIDNKASNFDAKALQNSMLDTKPAETSQYQLQKPQAVIDLHIEQLATNYDSLGPSDILNLQLLKFRSELDNAIISNMEEITFIHGVGNGVLKEKIQKELSEMKNIKYFKDAMKEKFGYGATLVRIK